MESAFVLQLQGMLKGNAGVVIDQELHALQASQQVMVIHFVNAAPDAAVVMQKDFFQVCKVCSIP
jgi:hypothetical protein